MAKGLVRSAKALSVINKFERTDAVMYVEGPSDRLFWKNIFDIYNVENISINIAGSCTIIDAYISNIVKDDVPIFVARDKDYKFHAGKIPMHERVLLSYGHSIENSLLCRQALIDIAVINGGELSKCFSFIKGWSDDFVESVNELIIREIANEISMAGLSVFGDHYEIFFGKQLKNGQLQKEKIDSHISNLDSYLSAESINDARDIFNVIKENGYWFIRGHFLFSVASKYMKILVGGFNEKGREPNISNDAMNMLLSQQFKFNIVSGVHPHKNHYENQVNKLKAVNA